MSNIAKRLIMKLTMATHCKHCLESRKDHEDWVATGEFSKNAVCTNMGMDKEGRYLKLSFFEPLDNVGYLALKHKRNQKKRKKK